MTFINKPASSTFNSSIQITKGREPVTAYYQSPIGWLVIQSSGNAISMISFANSAKGVKVQNSTMLAGGAVNGIIENCFEQLTGYFNGERKEFELNIKQEGTPFQQMVWSQLVKIPYGKTVSYLELSKQIGNPAAIRAVGTSNGRNQVAIVVPCHRVIGSNGNLTGYAGDLWRKQWLLDHEGKFAHGIQKLF